MPVSMQVGALYGFRWPHRSAGAFGARFSQTHQWEFVTGKFMALAQILGARTDLASHRLIISKLGKCKWENLALRIKLVLSGEEYVFMMIRFGMTSK